MSPADVVAATASPVGTADSRWQAMLDALPHPAWVVQLPERRVWAVNAAALAFLGQPREALVGAAAEDLAPSPEDLGFWAEVGRGGAPHLHSDTLVATAAGEAVPVSRSVRPLRDGEGRATHALVLLADRRAEHRAEREQALLLAEHRAVLESIEDGILVTDLGGRVRAFNRRFAQLWAMPLALLQQREEAVLNWMARSATDADAFDSRLAALAQAPLIAATDRIGLHTGQVFERVTRPLLVDGVLQGRVWCFRDLTDRLAAQSHLDALAINDALTGLANRRRLSELIADASEVARRDGGSFALLLVDLDRFRQLNDSLGHDAGDRVLLEVAQRLSGTVRQADLLARVGGDQFALLLRPADPASAEAAARRVLGVVAQACVIDGAQLALSCSIGVAMSPPRSVNGDEMLQMAAGALGAAKKGGRGGYRMHRQALETDRQSRAMLDQAMRRALVSGRFRLHYQPQVALTGGAVVGVEALLRWRDPALGEVAPETFLQIAEETGFIVAIGDWVLSQALRQVAQWHERGQALPVSVSVSPLQFQQRDFVDKVQAALSAAKVPATLLELELSEAMIAQDDEAAAHGLEALARLGVRLAVDDFGSGLSNAALLGRSPLGKVKIAAGFIAALPDSEGDAMVVRALLQMAHALGLHTVAEGLETDAQRQFLVGAGCDAAQGHLMAPALDALSLQKRLPAGSVVPPPPPRRPAPGRRFVSG